MIKKLVTIFILLFLLPSVIAAGLNNGDSANIALGTIIGGFFAFLFGLLIFFAILMLIVYVYTSLVLMTIAKKTNTEGAWMAWVPILNFYLMTKIGSVPWWTILIFIIGFSFPIISAAITIWWWWKIAEARGKPGWWALLFLIPLVGFVMMGMIAWSDSN